MSLAIVDINDRGGSVRAVSTGGPPAADILLALSDNPMGQGECGTPFVLLRPSPAASQQTAEHLPELAQLPRPLAAQREQVDGEA